MPNSAYIHIPFCLSKCKYCSFISFEKVNFIPEYIDSLIQEILKSYKGEPLKTLYFGGGTPSLVPIKLLEKIIKLFDFTQNAEITIEVNPDSVSKEYLRGLKQIGFNRISIGSQTFDDDILRLIGRRHNSEQIEKAVKNAKSAGFKNISLDLIYGLPTQTIESLEKDLKRLIELDIEHISTYGLKIDEGCYFASNRPKKLPNDDMQADMYLLINETLEKSGFSRYEVSNFAKQNFESRHNLNYWNNEEYYGFGVAAHGYIDGKRYSNQTTIKKYCENPLIHNETHALSEQERLEEEIFLGFRKREGINTALIKQKYGIEFENKYKDILKKYSDYIEKTPTGYSLNINGVLLSNVILSEFI